MKRKTVPFLLIFLSFSSFVFAASEEYKPDEILVRFVQVDGQSLSYSQKNQIVQQFVPGSSIVRSFNIVSDLTVIKLPPAMPVPEAVVKFNNIPLVFYAEPSYKMYPSIVPDDPNFPEQWALNNSIDTDIDAPEAWDIFTGTQSVVVAVIDTGVDYNHPDLRDNMWINYSEFFGAAGTDDDLNGYIDDIYGADPAGATAAANDPDGDPCDYNFHGTHVAGIIGAVGDNATGITGVCWSVRIMAVKIFANDSGFAYTDDEIAGIEYAVLNGAQVINASWGGTGYSQALYDSIAKARDAGVLFVAAAMNNSMNNDTFPAYPASYDLDNIISVMATDMTDDVAIFSNYGPNTVHLAAPGVEILSTTPTYQTVDMNDVNVPIEQRTVIDVNYDTLSGTSMAAPHVAGAAALMWGFEPRLDYKIIREAIFYSVDKLPSLQGRCITEGRLNLKNAMEAVNPKVLNVRTSRIYNTIQAAIDDALDGDELIADMRHWFFESIDFGGKDVFLRSGDIFNPTDTDIHPENTYISARGQNSRAVTFQSGESPNATISGFSIIEGYADGSILFDKFGGGIYCAGSSPSIDNCIIRDNHAKIDGGGIYCDDDSNPSISNCTITENTADGRDGGGIYCYDSSPLIFNCLIVNNTALRDGGGIYFNGSSLSHGEAKVNNCTISGNTPNPYDGLGGAVYCYWRVEPEIKNTIITSSPGFAIYEEDNLSDPVLTNCLFYNNPDGDYYDADTQKVYTGAAQINSLNEASGTIDGDPLFVRGRLGDYYLSQIAAGQLADSNAVDAGSDTAENLGLNYYSTRTDNVLDEGIVDLGFHYNDPVAPLTFTLNTYVIPAGRASLTPAPGTPHTYPQFAHVQLVAQVTDTRYQFRAWHGTDDDTKREVNPSNDVPLTVQHNIVTMDSDKVVTAEFETRLVSLVVTVTSGNGSVEMSPPPEDPRRDLYIRGTVVTLTATPVNPSHRVQWTGTDDDTTTSLVNTVTMNVDREVSVQFYAPRILDVGGGGEPGVYTNLGEAIEDSRNGDVIVLHEGEWVWSGFSFDIIGKAITIRSTNPDDPCVVARTILGNSLNIEQCGRDTVLAGITISNITIWQPVPSGDGVGALTDPAFSDCDGSNGSSIFGGALTIGQRNQNSVMFPDLGFEGYESSPTIVNCVIRNMNIWAGDGGNGVTSNDCSAPGDGGWGGKAYGAGAYIGPGCKPIFKNVVIRDCNATGGDGGNPGNGGYVGSWGDPTGVTNNWFFGPYDEVWKYSGHGGGVYCDVNSAPEFIDCNFINNTVRGGSSGDAPYLLGHLRIDSYGGAAYCAAQSSPIFVNCTFTDSSVHTVGASPLWRWSPKLAAPTNAAVVLPDKYFGYGGAVAGVGYTRSYEGLAPSVAIEGGQPVFENCKFIGSWAGNGTGGAMHWMRASPFFDHCMIENSTALHGGAAYLVNGNDYILDSTFINNTATDEVGEGGAIYIFDANTMVADCNIVSNAAVSSGGGVFISGSSNVTLKNCLITDNNSLRDGGGVSVNIHADVNLINCTITGNLGGKYGGGLYCSYSAFTKVLDSIIWGNFAADGHQIAITTADPYYPQPSVVEVSYSSVGPRYAFSGYATEPVVADVGAGGGGAAVIGSDQIYSELVGTGWAKIIISIDEPFELKKNMNWNSPQELAILQTEIHNRQSAVLSTLTSSEFTLRYRYGNIAAFSGYINESGLLKLQTNPMVRIIEPVRQMHWQMKQALALANGMGIRPTYSGSGTAIAICDSGFDYRHTRLGGTTTFPNTKIIGGYDFGADDPDPMAEGEAHGTACAGIAAGRLGGIIGDYIGGVAYAAGIYGLKISVGAGGPLTDAAIAGWDWCVTHKNDNPNKVIVAISNSWGGFLYNDPALADADFPAMANAARNAVAAGITVLAASGNEGAVNALNVPAALSDVISVGAVFDTTDQVTPYSNAANILDILAPGDPIYTTDITGTEGYAAGDYYPYFNGTSAACPFAAGVVSVVQSAAKQKLGSFIAPEQMRLLLRSSGKPITDGKVDITKPRIDIGAAVAALNASPIYIEQGSRIEHNWWNPQNFTWAPESHNLDVNDNPLFVEGFYLSQIATGDQDVDSNDVDAGDMDAFTADFYRHTTRTDLEIEDYDSIIDLGWHYIRMTEFVGDLNYDGIVDWADFERFMRHWLSDCGFPDYCHGADFNKDGRVNFYDYAIFLENFGKQETTPPEPNPMTWEVYPYSAPNATWVTMTGTKAKDNYGGPIEYYFQRTNEQGTPDKAFRDWDPNRTWTQNGLTVGTTYGYKVKARDKRGNETGWSVLGLVTIGEQAVPDTPINLEAEAINENQIDLAWTDQSFNENGFSIERRTGTDPFAEVTTVGANVTSYSDLGLAPGTTYTYRVFAFNGAGKSNPSNEASATTPDDGGGPTPTEPNQPIMIYGNVDPNSREYYDSNDGYWYHLVVAQVPDLGGPIPVWFRFVCLDYPAFNSQWVNAAGAFPHPVVFDPPLPDVVITVNGTTVTYLIAVKAGGSFGWGANWQVCASYNANGTNPACSLPLRIPPPP